MVCFYRIDGDGEGKVEGGTSGVNWRDENADDVGFEPVFVDALREWRAERWGEASDDV